MMKQGYTNPRVTCTDAAWNAGLYLILPAQRAAYEDLDPRRLF
jgi:hypothetical protein